jgi:peptide/nickel transport system substrate-binding protein
MLDTHILRVINDEGAWPPALSNGEIDGGSPPQMNEDVVTQLQNAPGVQVQVGAGPSWEHLDFNLQNPWLQDRERRRAQPHLPEHQRAPRRRGLGDRAGQR